MLPTTTTATTFCIQNGCSTSNNESLRWLYQRFSRWSHPERVRELAVFERHFICLLLLRMDPHYFDSFFASLDALPSSASHPDGNTSASKEYCPLIEWFFSFASELGVSLLLSKRKNSTRSPLCSTLSLFVFSLFVQQTLFFVETTICTDQPSTAPKSSNNPASSAPSRPKQLEMPFQLFQVCFLTSIYSIIVHSWKQYCSSILISNSPTHDN